MHINITTNIPQFQALVRQKSALAPAVVQKAVIDVTAVTLVESRNQLSAMVYNKPIPKRKRSGKPAWKRTNHLINQERSYHPSRFEGIIDNKAPYAQARHDLNKPSPIDGKTRRAPWRRTAVKKVQPKVKAIVEAALSSITK